MTAAEMIGGRGSGLRAWLFREIAKSRAEGRRVVLLVPEQYTLQAERDLILGMELPGLLDIDVISPTKLKSLVKEYAGYSGHSALDETGCAMAVRRAIRECGEKLKYYPKVTEIPGAALRLEQTLSELRESGMTPEELEETAAGARNEAERAKLGDLAMIWRAYDELLKDRFDDPTAAWADLCARLERSGVLTGADLYIYGFDTVRPDLRRLIAEAVRLCARVAVLLTAADAEAPAGRIFRPQRDSMAMLRKELEERGAEAKTVWLEEETADKPESLRFLQKNLFSDEPESYGGIPGDELSLYLAANPTAEAWNAVTTLLRWHGEGIAWNRMAVAMPGYTATASALTAALRSNGIPFFYNRKDQAARHGVSRLLTGALECAAEGYTTERLALAALSGYGPLTKEEGTRLMNYAAARGIDRARWRSPFTRGEDAAEAEKLRLRLTGPIDVLHAELRNARTATAGVEAVFRFLQQGNVYAQLQRRQKELTELKLYREAVVDRQVWNLLMNILDQLWALLGGRRATLKEMAGSVTAALERSRLASLPEDEEGVALGEIGHMLPGQTDALILTGMNDGVMSPAESGILSDPERKTLEERTGREIGADRARMSMTAYADYYRTMTLPGKKLRLSRCMKDEDGTALLPGEPAEELKRLFPRLEEEGGASSDGRPEHPLTKSMAMEGLGIYLRDLRSGVLEDLPGEWKSALRSLWEDGEYGPSVREMVHRILPETAEKAIDPETAVKLFRAERISISRLESFAACPYRHFIRYGLRPVAQEAFEFTANEAGDFFHAVLEQYISRAVREKEWPELSDEKIGEMTEQIVAEQAAVWENGPLREDAAGIWESEEYARRAKHAAAVLTRFAANSDFRVVGTEMEFGSPEGLPPLMLTLKDGTQIALQGKIDRLDEYRGPDGDYLRVTDYKSSGRKPDPAKMASGEQLQLMIYLKAAQQAYPGAKAAGAFYFPVQDKEVDKESPEAAEEERLKAARMKGVALADPDVLHAMDRDIAPYSVDRVFNKDGSVSKSAKWALDEKILNGLTDAAVEKAAELCERIRSGEISATPSAEDENITACTFCDYITVCRRKKKDIRRRNTEITYADIAEKNTLRNPHD